MNSSSPDITTSTSPRRKWRLALLFGVMLPALYCFGFLVEGIWNRGGWKWDTPVLMLLHKHDSPRLDRVLLSVSQIGDIRMVIFFTVVCAILLLVAKRQQDERFLARCVVGAAVIIFLVKASFHQVRLHYRELLPSQIDLGSPSAHSMGTFTLALGVAVIAWHTRWRWSVILLGSLYAGSVALSRVYLGIHQTSDVLAAWGLSLAWVCGLSVLRGVPFADFAFKRKGILLVSGILASLAAILLGYISSDLKHDNLRVLVFGQAYRSGQMQAEQLARTIEHCGIKSVLNLRGENPTAIWYQAEIATAAKLNVVHYDRSLSAGKELNIEEMSELVSLMQQAPKPLLIHCDGGADRSALVSALYLFALESRKPDDADKELSIWNGHMPLVWPRVTAMDRSFWQYVSNRTAHTELSLKPQSIPQ